MSRTLEVRLPSCDTEIVSWLAMKWAIPWEEALERVTLAGMSVCCLKPEKWGAIFLQDLCEECHDLIGDGLLDLDGVV